MAEKKPVPKWFPWVWLLVTAYGAFVLVTADDWSRWLGAVMVVAGLIATIESFRRLVKGTD